MFTSLAMVYGAGMLFFAWWDGGLMRRILMIFCIGLILAAGLHLTRSHPELFRHSTVTHRT